MLDALKDIFKPKAGAGPKLVRGGRMDVGRRFLLGEKTSQGSMSRTYRALDQLTGQTVCLKFQIPEKCAAAAARSDEKPCEGAIAFQVVHPNVVRTLDYGISDDREQVIVMEYVDGVSLEYVRESVKLGLRGKVKILAMAAEGFAAIHRAGFIHHDINPRNVLINKQNQVKIIDFGLAVPNTPAFHKPGNRTGALPYMAPELIRREPTDASLDVFAFGALAFELLTNRLPYEGGTSMAMMLQRINHAPMDPAEANPKLSEGLCDLLRRCLARRKEDRPSMASAAAALTTVPARRDSAGSV